MTAPVVGVVGMRALRKDINKLATDERGAFYAALKAAGKQAAEPVAAATRSALPHVSGDLAGDVRVSATKTGASVRMGRAKIPYAGWIEFGGTRHRPHESTRDYTPRGRYLFPAAEGLAEPTARLYSDAVTVALNNVNWTNQSADPAAAHD